MPKHWRPPSSRLHGTPDHKNADPWNKQPRPLENGNWVCEDSHCANVNYPRRTECYKCGKCRGPVGDAVVKAYIEKVKMLKHPARKTYPMQEMLSSCSTLISEFDPWLGAGLEQLQFGPSDSDGEKCLPGQTYSLSAATEGKWLAEHLVACFASSSDPLGDAGECLASAALWLQTLKSRIQVQGNTLSTSPVVSVGLSTAGGLPFGVNAALNVLSQPHFGGNLVPGAVLGVRNMFNCSNSSLSSSSGSQKIIQASLKWEDYKDRPSDFLREFGDPAAMIGSAVGRGIKPEPGVNGNWECEECENVNFPRRTSCFQCHKKRGPKGDDLVRKYVRRLFDEPVTVWTSERSHV